MFPMNKLFNISKNVTSFFYVLSLVAVFLLVGKIGAQEFKQFSVSYKLDGKDMSNTIYIPQYSGGVQSPIRGVMQNVRGPLKEFAHEARRV